MKALAVQIATTFICGGFLFLFRAVLLIQLPLVVYLLAHAFVAASMAFLLRMDWWWWIIQFFFPLFVTLFLYWDLPAVVYLIGFVILGLTYWSIFLTRVPYYPSKSSLYPAILNLLPPNTCVNMIDIGSGMGGLLMHLARVRSESHFVGIEIAPLPWLLSFIKGRVLRSAVHFRYGSYESLHLSSFDVVFAYLSPAAMPSLWNKAIQEMRPGCLLMSYEFVIPGVEPYLCVNIATNEPILYVWRI